MVSKLNRYFSDFKQDEEQAETEDTVSNYSRGKKQRQTGKGKTSPKKAWITFTR